MHFGLFLLLIVDVSLIDTGFVGSHSPVYTFTKIYTCAETEVAFSVGGVACPVALGHYVVFVGV